MPRFYPNAVTLAPATRHVAEQRSTVDILLKSNLPGRWAVKDSFNTLDLVAAGFRRAVRGAVDPQRRCLVDATVIGTSSGSARPRASAFRLRCSSDRNFAMFTGRRDGEVVARRHALSRPTSVVGLSNVVAEADDAVAVWRDLAALAATTFPGLPLVGYRSGDELKAAANAGFEIGRSAADLGQVDAGREAARPSTPRSCATAAGR